ncbi:MAG: N-formylglutamate amidohydrolase [Maricaulaceae bacterium]
MTALSPLDSASDAAARAAALRDAFAPPVEVRLNSGPPGPIVLASPHAGRVYPDAFLKQTRLDPHTLRRSEDAYVDELVADAPALGAPLIIARFPRAYLDVNREPWELDPAMFADPLPGFVNTRSPRVGAGLGTVARLVADGAEIYAEPLVFADVAARVRALHGPYHAQLGELVRKARTRCGVAVLIDCHSMPSLSLEDSEDLRADIVLGDRFGAACAPTLTSFVDEKLSGFGYNVGRNAPYAGGYTTERYGRPARGVHALQIEIRRSLYMDENTVEPIAQFDQVRQDMASLVAALIDADPDLWRL